MKTKKGTNKQGARGTGKASAMSGARGAAVEKVAAAGGRVQVEQAPSVRGAICGRADVSRPLGEWSKAGRFNPAAVVIRSAPSSAVLTPGEAARFASRLRARLSILAATPGAAAVDETRRLVRAAERFGVEVVSPGAGGLNANEGAAAAAESFAAARAVRIAEDAAAVERARVHRRNEDAAAAGDDEAAALLAPCGTAAAQSRRAARISAQVEARPAALHSLVPLANLDGGPVRREVLLTWERVARKAERAAARWVAEGGDGGRAAREKGEIGAAAAADDLAAYHVRLVEESRGIHRAVYFERAGKLLEALAAAGVRVNRRARRAIVEPCAIVRPLSRVVGTGRGRRRIRVEAPRAAVLAAAVRGGANLAALGVVLALALPVHVVGFSCPPSSRAAARACSAWEYAAVRGRDGREIGAGFAMQGAIHGLRDFALGDAPASSDGPESDDFGAAEWAAQVDAAAARMGAAAAETRAGELVADGYSAKLAAVLAADEVRGPVESGPVDLGGALSFAPTAGAGTGRPAWLAESIAAAVETARAAAAERLAGACNGGAAAKLGGVNAAAERLFSAVSAWVENGERFPADILAEWGAGWDGERWDAAARQRFSRLRKRFAVERVNGPRAAALCHTPGDALGRYGRPVATVAGDEVAAAQSVAPFASFGPCSVL